ncbi:hypothetical protein [Salinisphaera sp. Q1T1-3]|uniref:hypothetical protein n=1 Tax=Salinisphaera sp. Q1T1-3 TaxID=2321229 RepID=UPI000E71AB5F|nr:hypothetical protein [Salinisphaera sp. Q1T1-3]RJS92667.1 hypothetical protein D3260_10570 [Salinisphaera sp. Q1T1-3]
MTTIGTGRGVRLLMLGILLGGSVPTAVVAAPPDNAGAELQQPANLVQAWLSFPDAVSIDWPYAFITARQSEAGENAGRQDLLDEFGRLEWRLKDYGYARLAETIDTWREKIKTFKTFRVPGHWSPAYLLAHPDRQPPIANIAAVGACEVPSDVGVWSADGFESIQWRSGLRLSDIEKRVPALRDGSKPMVAVVDPYGHIDHYGVEAWNYADGPVEPGSQIVASLPLKGEAFGWIRDRMADFLAHTPSGVNCRQTKIAGETDSDDNDT